MEIAGRITLGRECQAIEWTVDVAHSEPTRRKWCSICRDSSTWSSTVDRNSRRMCCGKMQAGGGELRASRQLHPKVAEVMRVTKLNQIMVFYPTAAAAAENFELSR